MKNFSLSTFGIWIISVLPAILTYVTFFLAMKIDFNDIKPHIPFISSIIILLLSVLILNIRKKVKEKLVKIESLEGTHKNISNENFSNRIKELEKIKNIDVINELTSLRKDLKDEFINIYLKSKKPSRTSNDLNWDANDIFNRDDVKNLYTYEEKTFLKDFKSKFKP